MQLTLCLAPPSNLTDQSCLSIVMTLELNDSDQLKLIDYIIRQDTHPDRLEQNELCVLIGQIQRQAL